MGKKPPTALLCSIVPGFGQFYNGDLKRGLLIISLFLIATALTLPSGCLSDLLAAAVWTWGGVNAWNVAAQKTPLWT